MKLGTKIALGFTSLVVLAVLLGAMAVWNMKGVEGEADVLANQYVPEVKYANNLERNSLQTMYNMRGYGLSEQNHYLEAGRKAMADTNQALTDCTALAEKSDRLKKLKSAVVQAKGCL